MTNKLKIFCESQKKIQKHANLLLNDEPTSVTYKVYNSLVDVFESDLDLLFKVTYLPNGMIRIEPKEQPQ